MGVLVSSPRWRDCAQRDYRIRFGSRAARISFGVVASRESTVLAERLIAESVRKQGIDRDQLTLHAEPLRGDRVCRGGDEGR
jgi:hypothetical protein